MITKILDIQKNPLNLLNPFITLLSVLFEFKKKSRIDAGKYTVQLTQKPCQN